MVSNFSRKISLRNENLFGYISMGFTSFLLKICMRVPVDINFELLKNCGNQRKSLYPLGIPKDPECWSGRS